MYEICTTEPTVIFGGHFFSSLSMAMLGERQLSWYLVQSDH